MTLTTGTKLSHYEITSQVGKGGMGEVYKAKDQKLGRDVAIKVLPEEFAKDADRVARFQREAKLLASLNHPNIAAIHGLEESDGIHFLVLELIEGDTLANRIKAGPIPVEESLKLALQIAEALEAAHEKGVIHRDLKPANIKVTPDGKVKVLDFGLAKAFAPEQEQMILSDSPTISVAATQKGVILGTAAYMPPEQAKGKTVDKRADIWAFGCVLYEMLTGQAAFQGEDVSEILASVVKASVNLDLVPANVHPRVHEIIFRCLQKDLKDRYQDIGDAQHEIRQVLADPSGMFAPPVNADGPRGKLQFILSWVAAAVILTAIVVGVAIWNLKPIPAPVSTVTRFPLNLPEGIEIPSTEGGVAISPDGTRIVYAAVRNGSRRLYLRSRDQLEPILIANTENGTHPFFSSDGKRIGFFTGSELKKVSLSGGPAQTLLSAIYRRGASWGPDNTIVFASDDAPSLMKVSASGGEPQPLTSPKSGERHIFPEFLPNGKAVLFTIIGSASRPLSTAKVAVLSLETGKYHLLVNGVDAHFAPSGHLVFGREASLWAAPFDAERLELAGDPVLVAENVQVNIGGWAHYALATDGTLVYMSSTTLSSGFKRMLVWVDRQGREELISASPNNYRSPRISPDGTKVALSIAADDNTYDIWIWDIISEIMTRLTFNENSNYPLWTLDGQRVAFVSGSGDEESVYWKAANGTGDDELLVSKPDQTIMPWSWSSDGNTLVTVDSLGGNVNIGSLSMEGGHPYKALLKEEYAEYQPKVSPDGRWMAYFSMESGDAEIYVRPFPDVDKGRWQVSTDGGYDPLWSPDGGELFYFNGDSVMAVSVETEPIFEAGKPEILFQAPDFGFSVEDFNSWDISPDGKRFLMMKMAAVDTSIEGTSQPKINIVLNWFEELKERVPIN